MGSGPSAVKNAEIFKSTINNVVSNRLINISKTTANIVSGIQMVNINNMQCGGDFILGSIDQTMVTTININALSSIVTKDTLNNILVDAVSQASKANQSIESDFISASGSASDSTTTKSEVIQHIVSNYTYNDFQSDLQRIDNEQKIGISNVVARNCNLGDINQNMQLNSIAKNIAEKLTSSAIKLAADLGIDQSSSADQDVEAKGIFSNLGELFSGPFKWIAIGMIASVFFIFVLIIGIIIYRSISSSSNHSPTAVPMYSRDGMRQPFY